MLFLLFHKSIRLFSVLKTTKALCEMVPLLILKDPGGSLHDPCCPGLPGLSPPGAFSEMRGLLDTSLSPEREERQQVPRTTQLGCQVTVVTIATLSPWREQKPQHPHLQKRGGEGSNGGSSLTTWPAVSWGFALPLALPGSSSLWAGAMERAAACMAVKDPCGPGAGPGNRPLLPPPPPLCPCPEPRFPHPPVVTAAFLPCSQCLPCPGLPLAGYPSGLAWC